MGLDFGVLRDGIGWIPNLHCIGWYCIPYTALLTVYTTQIDIFNV